MQTSGTECGRRVVGVVATGLFALALGLTGCSGGGDDPAEPPAAEPQTYPVEATLTTLFTTENDLMSSAYVDPANREDYTFKTHISPAPVDHIVQFGGKGDMLVRVSYLTNTLTRNGLKVWDSKATLLYTTAPLVWHGQIDDEGTYSVHDPVKALPVRAEIGHRANWFTSVDYSNRERTVVKQRSTVDYYLAAGDAAGTAWLCLDFTVKEEASGVTQSSSTCMKTDATGGVLEVKRQGPAAL